MEVQRLWWKSVTETAGYMKGENSLCARIVSGQLRSDGQLNGPRGLLLQGQFVIGLPIMKVMIKNTPARRILHHLTAMDFWHPVGKGLCLD